jgi:hypothetical protein
LVEPQLRIHLRIKFLLELTNLTELAFLKDSINIKGGRDFKRNLRILFW